MAAAFLLLGASLFSGCGGGGASGGAPKANPIPDFSLSFPSSVSVRQGYSALASISIIPVNGFNSPVSVAISAIPPGVTGTPSSFNLSVGNPQQVTLSADMTATVTTTSLVISATSGALQHSYSLSLQVTANPRVRFIQTDTQWDTAFLNYFPQPLILYDPGTKRFFLSDSWLNQVVVIDAASQQVIAKIPVPGAFVGDETPDHTKIYMGTQIGDVYQIDPVGMKVVQRFPAVQIGPAGFAAYQAKVMYDGSLALLGGQGGIPAIDGYSAIGIWNPATNTFVQFGATNSVGGPTPAGPICGGMAYIAEFALTADRTQILVSSADSDGTLCLFNPATQTEVFAKANNVKPIMTTADGKAILTSTGTQITVYDSTDLMQLDQFQVDGGAIPFNFVLSPDGNTLYAVGHNGATALAINWRTHQQLGWFLNYNTYDNPFASDPVPLAVDETGLIANAIDHGVAMLDGSVLMAQQPKQAFSFAYSNVVQPTFGPVQGGAQSVITGVQITNVADVQFGQNQAAIVSTGNSGITVRTPAGSPGPVDVVMHATDNSFLFLPKAYSYGPSIVEVTPNSSTADGGASGTILGYGFGSADYNGKQDSGLQVSVGGQSATITQYLSQPYSGSIWYPFPLEGIEYTIPPGSSGQAADVTVSTSAGSVTESKSFQYVPAIQQFPLTGAVLVQGIYDPIRNLYYFTDRTQVQVFSRAAGQWLSPIPMPGGASRLWGISLSPDGSKLAVSDAGTNLIYVFNPDAPSAIGIFPLPNTGFDQGYQPCGLAISDSGIVYYATFSLYFTGGWALHKLDTSTGTVTDYQVIQAGNLAGDAYTRVLMTKDNSRVYANVGGIVLALDTASDTFVFNPTIVAGDDELTLSSNQTWMSASEYVMDTNLNPQSYSVYVDRDIWNVSAVYGEKLSPDGNLLFSPLTNAIDVIDGHLGTLLTRIALPVTLSSNYDALVSDGRDNVLVAITGSTGSGIAILDLSSVAEPLAAAGTSFVRSSFLRNRPWTIASKANLERFIAKPTSPSAAPLLMRPYRMTEPPILAAKP